MPPLLAPLSLVAAAVGIAGDNDEDEDAEEDAVGPPSREGGTAAKEVGVEEEEVEEEEEGEEESGRLCR